MPRVLVLWSRPPHLTREEAERWAHAEIRVVLGADCVRSGELSRLESASPRYGTDWNWLLELDVAAPVSACVEQGPCADWLADLRLLGMRPAVMVAG